MTSAQSGRKPTKKGRGADDKRKVPAKPAPHYAGDNDRHVEEALDSALDDSFPASDPIPPTRGAD